ncbi:MAG: hypothetical protein AAF193_09500 [Bacteroidota bacterium]
MDGLQPLRDSKSANNLLKKVILQLNKDYGDDFLSAELERLDQLQHALINELEVLMSCNVEKLMQWTYRMDLSQERVQRVLSGESWEHPMEEMSTLMILRELQKIQMRENWSKMLDSAPQTTQSY